MAAGRRGSAERAERPWDLPARYLNPEDLAELFELPSVETVYQWRRKRTGPLGFRVGRHLRFDRPTCGPGWTASVGRWPPDGRAHSGPLVPGRGRAGRQGPEGEDGALRLGAAVPRPLHRPGRDGEEQELPRPASAAGGSMVAQTKADMERGQYVDPKASRVTFRQYAERWLKNHGADPNTGFSMESQLRLHAFPYIGPRPAWVVPARAHPGLGG